MKAKDWDFTVTLNDGATSGGLVLSDVNHAHHRFARDLRVVRVWVSDMLPTTAKPVATYVLGTPACLATTGIVPTWSPQQTLLAKYPALLEVSASFKTGSAIGSQDDSGPLTITQAYLFTDYSNSPAHEPSGVLTAARLYPFIHFKYPGKRNEVRPPRYLRFDYRIELALHSFLTPKPGAARDPNQVGVFLDRDSIAGGVFNRLMPGTHNIDAIFAAGEKPLSSEMIGQGLKRGSAGIAESADWDNIHQWGAGNALPSTPGAFHAAHIHWRWGKPAAHPTGPPFYGKGGYQFVGVHGPGGPLLDARIPDQALRFAIVGYDDALPLPPDWNVGANESTAPFDELFTRERRNPQPLATGRNIVIWISVEVFRSDVSIKLGHDWTGTLFIHGMYFAHEPESASWQMVGAGVLEPIHEPGTGHGWVRP